MARISLNRVGSRAVRTVCPAISGPVAAPPGQLWLRIVAPTPAFSLAMKPLWTAQPGDRYAIPQVDADWTLVVWEHDTPEWQEWVQIEGRVELTPS